MYHTLLKGIVTCCGEAALSCWVVRAYCH